MSAPLLRFSGDTLPFLHPLNRYWKTRRIVMDRISLQVSFKLLLRRMNERWDEKLEQGARCKSWHDTL
jgi:hypothetical protein